MEQLPLRAADVAKATRIATVLARVYHFIQRGWPKLELDKIIHPYFARRFQLTVHIAVVF